MRDEPLGVPGYVTVKQAASMLGLSASRIYEYVESGRFSSVRVANVILIPLDEITNFKPQLVRRPRKSLLRWHVSPDNNRLLSTSLLVRLRTGQEEKLMQRLEEIRRGDQHLFPGTIARFITKSQTFPDQVEFTLIWRSAGPNKTARSVALDEFREALADVLNWDTAEYHEGHLLMHVY